MTRERTDGVFNRHVGGKAGRAVDVKVEGSHTPWGIGEKTPDRGVEPRPSNPTLLLARSHGVPNLTLLTAWRRHLPFGPRR